MKRAARTTPRCIRLTWTDRQPAEPVEPVVLERIESGSSDLRLVHGDNSATLAALLPELEGSVALAYLDPPFLTGRTHAHVTRVRARGARAIRRTSELAFDDRWGDLAEYLGALEARLELVRRVLRPDGCVIVHVDTRVSHYAKVLCDEVFGDRAFASEIVWRYRRWPAKTPNFQRLHDVLLRYVRDPRVRPRFVQLFEPLADSTQKTWGAGRQRAIVGARGRRLRSSTLEEPSPGAPLGDVWDIGIIAPVARERTGYPTQKPEALLERLVLSCTHPGDLVLDPYCGSGTTLAVCAKLGRPAIGIDESTVAIDVARSRLGALGFTASLDRPSRPSNRLTARRAGR